jgi:hypothetical protein
MCIAGRFVQRRPQPRLTWGTGGVQRGEETQRERVAIDRMSTASSDDHARRLFFLRAQG